MYGLDRITGFFEAFTMGNWMYLIATFCYFVAATCFFLILYEIYKVLKLSHYSRSEKFHILKNELRYINNQLNQIHTAISAEKVEYHIKMPRNKITKKKVKAKTKTKIKK